MKILFLIVLLIFPLTSTALISQPKNNPKSCVEMMKLYYSWLNLGKCTLANKQLDLSVKVCRKFMVKQSDREWIELMIKKDDHLVELYEKLLKKNKIPRKLCPHGTRAKKKTFNVS